MPDALIRVRLLTAAEGGRKGSIGITNLPYACVLRVGGDSFDCRVAVQHTTLELGKTYELPINFLSPSSALRTLSPGMAITLWEGRDIAAGEVVDMSGKSNC